MDALINFVLRKVFIHKDTCKRFKKTSLPDKKSITEMSIIREWKNFEIKYLEDYHDLYVQSDTLLPANIFESFLQRY